MMLNIIQLEMVYVLLKERDKNDFNCKFKQFRSYL